jgi:intraflagellar transport protein 140
LNELKVDGEKARQLAELCEQQEAYIQAAQIYIKIGDHVNAMRNVIADGDTEKVIRFANLLKRKEEYVLAGDYVATSRPREGQQLFNSCIQMYQKGGAFDRIAEFLADCAQLEIDEGQNYEKAIVLLKRAHQTLAKAKLTKERDVMVESYLQRIGWIEMYIEACRCVMDDPLRMRTICNELLQTRGVEKCLRVEDIYLLLVQYFVAQGNYGEAHYVLELRRHEGVDLTTFMDLESITRIYKAAGDTYVPDADREEEGIGEEPEIPDDVVEAVADDF